MRIDSALGEVRYGSWTGRRIADLTREPLWRVVQDHPSAVTFPDGEAMAAMQARAVAAVRAHDAEVLAENGAEATWLAVSHGDVIKAILADALGLHLDQFQRIVVDTASISVVRYTATRPFVLHLNDTAADLSTLNPRPHVADQALAPSDAVIGGNTGQE